MSPRPLLIDAYAFDLILIDGRGIVIDYPIHVPSLTILVSAVLVFFIVRTDRQTDRDRESQTESQTGC